MKNDTVSEIKEPANKEAAKPEAAPKTELVNAVRDEYGVIAKDTRITGDIKTEGHLTIEGIVRGNIEAKGNVVVAGSVFGNIACDNLILQQGDLTDSEITANGHVVIESEVSVKGRVKCRDITIYGRLEGSVEAKEKAQIGEEGIFDGDIRAASLGVQPGARISGTVNVTGNN